METMEIRRETWVDSFDDEIGILEANMDAQSLSRPSVGQSQRQMPMDKSARSYKRFSSKTSDNVSDNMSRLTTQGNSQSMTNCLRIL